MSSNVIHVYPENDLLPHITDGLGCPCNPTIERVEGGTLVIHNSYDRRELAEQPQEAA